MEESYMTEIVKKNSTLTLPLVALRDIVIYPRMTVNLDIGRKDSIAAVRFASKGDQYVVTAMQKDTAIGNPEVDDLYRVGTVVKINQMLQLPGGLMRILAEGVSRVNILQRTMGFRQKWMT